MARKYNRVRTVLAMRLWCQPGCKRLEICRAHKTNFDTLRAQRLEKAQHVGAYRLIIAVVLAIGECATGHI